VAIDLRIREGQAYLRRPTSAPAAARATHGPAEVVVATGGTSSPASAAALGQATGAGRLRRHRSCGPPCTNSSFDPATAEASTAPLSSSPQLRLCQPPAAASNRMHVAKPTLRRL
jgi:hypothetical protein